VNSMHINKDVVCYAVVINNPLNLRGLNQQRVIFNSTCLSQASRDCCCFPVSHLRTQADGASIMFTIADCSKRKGAFGHTFIK
jgi:hypothetical protein